MLRHTAGSVFCVVLQAEGQCPATERYLHFKRPHVLLSVLRLVHLRVRLLRRTGCCYTAVEMDAQLWTLAA